MDPVVERREREDRLDKGGVRVARFLMLPAALALVLLSLAYFLQITITGWRGLTWAAAIVAPLWAFAFIACANDPYGVNVLVSWFKCCAWLKDEGFGGDSFAPLPQASGIRMRGMFTHAQH